jgi:hypothetical protein
MRASGKLLALAASSLLCVIASAYAEDARMTPDEIKNAWVGKKLLLEVPTNLTLSQYVHADLYLKTDGSVDLEGNGWGHRGKWRLSDDGYCTTYKTLRNGQERCFTVVKNGSTASIVNPDRSVASRVVKVTDL